MRTKKTNAKKRTEAKPIITAGIIYAVTPSWRKEPTKKAIMDMGIIFFNTIFSRALPIAALDETLFVA